MDDFDAFVARRRPVLIRSVVLMGCPQGDAEDVVQIALLRCLRSWHRVAVAADPDAYVHRVLINTFRDARSRRWNGEVPVDLHPELLAADMDPTVGLMVRRVLLTMRPLHREVLVLRFFADLSEQQTAAALRVPVGTVKSRTARALALLSGDEHLIAHRSGTES